MENFRLGKDVFVVTSRDGSIFYGAYPDVDEARSRTGYGATDAIILVYTPANLPEVNPSGDN